jgi:hypothetical protein
LSEFPVHDGTSFPEKVDFVDGRTKVSNL